MLLRGSGLGGLPLSRVQVQQVFPSSWSPILRNLSSKIVEEQQPRKWTVNGAIDYRFGDANRFFFANVHEQVNPLVKGLKEGHYVMFHGSRGCGKSTQANVAHSILEKEPNFRVISTTFQDGIDFSSMSGFWESFGFRFQRAARLPHPIRTMSDFVGIFDHEKSPFSRNTKVILFVDEFDLLYTASQEVTNSFLNTLRAMKHFKSERYLHAVCAIGPFSILKLTGASSSPFNVSEAVPTQWLTHAHVKELFEQWHKTKPYIRIQGVEDIVKDVYERTSGHAGLVQKCGKEIDEVLISGRNDLSYEQWLQYAVLHLPDKLGEWGTMRKMFDILRGKTTEVHEARKLLATKFLPAADRFGPHLQNVEACSIRDMNQLKLAEFLAAEGALVSVGKDVQCFALPSPLIAVALNLKVLSLDRPEGVPNKPFPFTKEELIDIQDVISTLVCQFSPRIFSRGAMKRDPRNSKKFVSREIVYQSQFYSLLQFWAPIDDVSLMLEYPIPPYERCDLIIERAIVSRAAGRQRVVMEFVATETTSKIQEHIKRIKDYAQALNATEAWVVHFRQDSDVNGAPSQDEWVTEPQQMAVKVVHIVHTTDFSQVKIYTDTDRTQGTLLQHTK